MKLEKEDYFYRLSIYKWKLRLISFLGALIIILIGMGFGLFCGLMIDTLNL